MMALNGQIAAVDLFCGVGGLTHGLERAGIDVRLGVDKDSACAYPFEANNRGRFLEADVVDLAAARVVEAFGDSAISLLAGCAPCQPFSTYARKAKRNHDGTRRGRGHPDDWMLLRRFGELVTTVRPDLVTIENVPPILDQEIFRNLVALISRDYYVSYKIVECQIIGLPQTRKRLVLVASRLGPIEINEIFRPPSTVRKAIACLPKLDAGQVDQEDSIHRACTLSDLNLQRIRASRPGGTWRDWPIGLRATCHDRPTGATYPSVYGRMEWDGPAPTITTQAFGFGNGRFGHPEQDRAISLREAAMLQGFPRNYRFVRPGEKVSFSTLGRLIGNAVPVPLGEIIGELFQEHVRERLS